MPKIAGWEKVDDYVWRRRWQLNSQLYEFLIVTSKNTVRIADGLPKNTSPMEITMKSYELAKFDTLKEARYFAINFMKLHPNK